MSESVRSAVVGAQLAKEYWLDLFSVDTWDEFLSAGGTISGFSASRWGHVQSIKVGDLLLCYLTGISRFVGILEVTCSPYKSDEPKIWTADYPNRVDVFIETQLTPETAVPVHDLLPQLSFFDPSHPNYWSLKFRSSPEKWDASDAMVVIQALREAARNPIHRPTKPSRKPNKPKPKNVQISEVLGPVSIPGSLNETQVVRYDSEHMAVIDESLPESTVHTEIQWRLLTLGRNLGLSLWVARNDRSKVYDGDKLGDLPGILDQLPGQFDPATQSTIELIDVLWLNGKSIVAAFEIESTTSIYSGLLRMSDLIAMQPNLNIPLYIVAPDERRKKVSAEINRPTFSQLHPPLREQCKYLSFSALRNEVPTQDHLLRNLRPQFIADLAEAFTE